MASATSTRRLDTAIQDVEVLMKKALAMRDSCENQTDVNRWRYAFLELGKASRLLKSAKAHILATT